MTVRILDFAHASEYITRIGQSSGPEGALLEADEQALLRRTLKRDGVEPVLKRLREVVASVPEQAEVATQGAYLETRVAQMAYQHFMAEGWPIGSGVVESANKLVVEDRLKDAGMHWAERNVNPLLALRNAVCNDRWQESWNVIEQAQREKVSAKRQEKRVTRQFSPPSLTPVTKSEAADEAVARTSDKPLAKPLHPWRRTWSIRRQREIAGSA